MTQTSSTPPYTLQADEKVAQIMAYTQTTLYSADVVVKSMIRVSTWLRTNSAPDRVTLYNVKALNILTSTPPKPLVYAEVNLSISQILAFHLAPPAKDPLDYDATEPNRKMEPVNLQVSTFRIDGCLRLSTRSSMAKFLEVTRENFTGIYDAKITNILIPSLSPMTVPFLIVRQESTVFGRA